MACGELRAAEVGVADRVGLGGGPGSLKAHVVLHLIFHPEHAMDHRKLHWSVW